MNPIEHEDAWTRFLQSGTVYDYLRYRGAVRRADMPLKAVQPDAIDARGDYPAAIQEQ